MFIYNIQKGANTKYELDRIEQAKQIIEPFMLRRLKADVLKSLPTKTVEINNVAMTEHQQIRYDTLTAEIKEASKTETSENSHDHMTWLMMLRKLTNHPLLLRYHFVASSH